MDNHSLVNKKYLIDKLKRQYGDALGFQTHVNLTDIADMIEDAPEPDALDCERAVASKIFKFLEDRIMTDEGIDWPAYATFKEWVLGGGL